MTETLTFATPIENEGSEERKREREESTKKMS